MDPYVRLNEAKVKYLNAVMAHNQATERRDAAARAVERAEVECQRFEALKNPPDETPCIDEYGDPSTVGFERLWRQALSEAMRPPPEPIETHDLDPMSLRCRGCGMGEVEIHRLRARCRPVEIINTAGADSSHQI